MVSIKMKIGPKGQVVIPKVLRDEYGILSGDEVVFQDKPEGIVVSKPKKVDIGMFEKIAKKHGRKLTMKDIK